MGPDLTGLETKQKNTIEEALQSVLPVMRELSVAFSAQGKCSFEIFQGHSGYERLGAVFVDQQSSAGKTILPLSTLKAELINGEIDCSDAYRLALATLLPPLVNAVKDFSNGINTNMDREHPRVNYGNDQTYSPRYQAVKDTSDSFLIYFGHLLPSNVN